jgi:uncharacterized protein (UPF0332 family)
MEPVEFLKTAELLKAQSEQAHLRTSAGRSYYAAFLYFRERLKQIGLEKTKHPGRDAHAFVIQCLQFSDVKECVQISQNLRDLQQVREDADYHIEMPFSQNDADDAFLKAKKVIDDYKHIITSEKETALFEKASAYSKLKDWI